MKSIEIIENHQLSNGDTVRIHKLGRQYSFVRLFCEDQAPYMEQNIPLKQALSLVAGAIRADVLELD